MNASPTSQADLFERRERRLNVCVVGAFVVVDSLLGVSTPRQHPGTAIEFIGSLALMCQISLLAIWISLGQDKLAERLFCVAPAYLFLAWLLSTTSNFNPILPSAALALLLLYAIGAIIPYGLLRLLGVYCVLSPQTSAFQNVRRRRRPVQFSLASLFKFTFAAACVAGIMRLLRPRFEEAMMETIVFSLSSLFGLCAIWAALATGKFFRRTLGVYVRINHHWGRGTENCGD